MKLKLLFIFLSFSVANVFSQDTLLSQDLTSANDTFVLSIGSGFSTIDPAATGPNYYWDYSQLGRASQRIDTIFPLSATNFVFSLYFSINPNRSNQATKGATIPTIPGFPSLTDVFNFYNNSSTDFSQTGFGAVVSGIPLAIPYTPHDRIYRFPLKYNDEDSVNFSYEVDLSSTAGIYFGANKKRHNKVDGWGSLTTPFGTFDVLRVVSTIVEVDSVHIDSLGFGLKFPAITTREYKWMGTGFGLPVLQINTNETNIISQILYQDSIHTIGVDELETIAGNDLILYPNPAQHYLILRYSLNKKTDVTYELFSSDGRLVFSKNEKNLSIGKQASFIELTSLKLAPGIYNFRLNAGNNVVSRNVFIVADN